MFAGLVPRSERHSQRAFTDGYISINKDKPTAVSKRSVSINQALVSFI